MVSFTVFKGSKTGAIIESKSTREVGPDEVLVKITHSGVCGTDEHFLHADMVLGHEGAGVIEQIGSSVTKLKTSDHVGWGWVHSACGDCKHCLAGKDNLCPNSTNYGDADLDQGSFGTYAVWKAAFVYKIPGTMKLEHAAPLMCGGATVFQAMRDIRSTDRVGIIGIGGLGHLAIQFASKMGCDVVVFSSTDSKKEEATRLGATQFITTKDKSELDIGKPIDHLLVTTSQPPNWDLFLPLMAPQGCVHPITVSGGSLSVPYSTLMNKEMQIQGSLVSPRLRQQQMLEFAALHGIEPVIMKFPMSKEGVEKAMGTLREGKMRYRGVLVAE